MIFSLSPRPCGRVSFAASLAAGVGCAVFLALPAHAAGPNIVANPGFETGSFTDWTQTPASTGSDFAVSSYIPGVHSGKYAAVFGASGQTDDSISQTLATVAGDSYQISFWLVNRKGPSNDFHSSFGADPLLNFTDAAAFAYTQYTFTETAAGPSTTLTFGGRQLPGLIFLDDISVNDLGPNPVPEASTTASFGLLLALGLGGVVLTAKRKKAAASSS